MACPPEGEAKVVAVTIRVVHGKIKHEVGVSATDTVGDIKTELQRLTNVPAQNQKLMLKKKQLKDDTEVFFPNHPLTHKDKLMLIGTPLADLAMAVVVPTNVTAPKMGEEAKPVKENIQELPKHKKIIEKGLPEGAEMGNACSTEPLPEGGLKAIYNNMGTVSRLTFKEGNMCIATKERTDKVPFVTVGSITSEPVEDRKGYHVMCFNLGKADSNSKLYLYYVPAQYVEAVKANVLGGFR